jgi:hypothetical protein
VEEREANDLKRPRKVNEARIQRRTAPDPQTHVYRANEVLGPSMAIACDQPIAVLSGGSSRRDARRAGRMHAEEVGKRLSDAWGKTYPIIESVAVLPIRLTARELGRPESRHGPELKQGLEWA